MGATTYKAAAMRADSSRWRDGVAICGAVVVTMMGWAGCGDSGTDASAAVDVPDTADASADTAELDAGNDVVDGPFADIAIDTVAADTATIDTFADTALADTALADTALADTALADTAPADTALADTTVQDFPPTLGALSDLKMAQGTTRDIVLAVFDDTPAALTVTATSSDHDVLGPTELALSLADDGATWVLTLSPTVDAVGMTVVNVSVEDAAGSVAVEGFRLTVDVASTWTGVVGTGVTEEDAMRGIATDAEGNVYVTGLLWNNATGEHVGRVRAYDKHGVELWSATRASPHDVLVNEIVYWPAMNWVIVASQDKNVSNSNTQYAVVGAHDAATGAPVWQDQVDFFVDVNTDYTVGFTLAVDDMSLFLGGYFKRILPSGIYDYGSYVARWDTTDLVAGVSWTQELGVASVDGSRITHFQPTGDGGALVLGQTAQPVAGTTPLGDRDIMLYRYASDGSVISTLRFGTPQADYTSGLTSLANGRALVSGATRGDLGSTNLGNRDGFVMLLEADGTEVWSSQFGTGGDDSVTAIVVMPNEDVVVVGFNNYVQGTSCEGIVRRLNTKSGDVVWETPLVLGPSFILPHGVARVGEDVMVTGRTGVGSGTDSFTLRVDGSGVVQ